MKWINSFFQDKRYKIVLTYQNETSEEFLFSRNKDTIYFPKQCNEMREIHKNISDFERFQVP